MSPEKMEEIAQRVIKAYRDKNLKPGFGYTGLQEVDGVLQVVTGKRTCCAVGALLHGRRTHEPINPNHFDCLYPLVSEIIGAKVGYAFMSAFDGSLYCETEDAKLGAYVRFRVMEEGLTDDTGTV